MGLTYHIRFSDFPKPSSSPNFQAPSEASKKTGKEPQKRGQVSWQKPALLPSERASKDTVQPPSAQTDSNPSTSAKAAKNTS